MKLYFSPSACSLAPHIIAREVRVPFELIAVDLATHTLVRDGSDFLGISAKGQVPLLETATGELLSEGPVICQYLADQAGALSLMPAAGTPARYRVLEWQNFITSDLHKSFTVLFSKVSDDSKGFFGELLRKKYAWVDKQIKDGPFLTGDEFTAADAYLYVVTRWAAMVNVDLSGLANLHAFMQRVGARPAVQEALRAENPSA